MPFNHQLLQVIPFISFFPSKSDLLSEVNTQTQLTKSIRIELCKMKELNSN